MRAFWPTTCETEFSQIWGSISRLPISPGSISISISRQISEKTNKEILRKTVLLLLWS